MKRKTVIHETNQKNVIIKVHENSHISLRQLARETSVRKATVSSVFRMLHIEKFHPFYLSVHQALDATDFENRLNFCQWGICQYENDEIFFTEILFTDEAFLTNHGQLRKSKKFIIGRLRIRDG